MKNLKISKVIGYILLSPVILYCLLLILLLVSASFGIIEIKKFRVLLGSYLMNANNTLLNVGLLAIAGAYLIKEKEK